MVHLDVPQQISRELPAWMLDASICAAMSLGEPQVAAEALALLFRILSDRKRQSATGGSSKPLSTEGHSDETTAKRTRRTTSAGTAPRARRSALNTSAEVR
jgi:hypothetical protein